MPPNHARDKDDCAEHKTNFTGSNADQISFFISIGEE
jgi:hypothetical protein